MIPIQGFAPDLDPATPGILVDCTNVIPTLKGIAAAPSAVTEASALSAESRSAAVVRLTDDSFRVFAATQTDLYEFSAGSWTDRYSGSLTGNAESKHRFCQFGNITIAVNMIDATLKSTGSGVDFTALAGAPKATYCDTVAGFVMLANYNDGTTYGDGWYCSGYQDYTNWTPSVSSQCANGRLLDTPGPIRGLKRLGSNVIAYKDRSMYLGQYIGPPVIWSWTLISDAIGAAIHESIVSINTAHFFIGENDFYMYDGSQPVAIGSPVREWFFSDLNTQYRYKIQGVHDWANSCIHWYYPSSTSTTLDSCIIYNYKSDKWARANRSIECVVDYLTSGTGSTYDGASGTFDASTVIFDSLSLLTYGRVVGIIDTSHILKTLSGASSSSSITTGDIGDDQEVSLLKRVIPRWTTAPTSATMTNYYRMTLGDSLTTGGTTSMSSNRFDVLRAARWHRLTLNITGDAEIIGADIQMDTVGTE